MRIICTKTGRHREVVIGEFRNGRMATNGEAIWWMRFGHWAEMDSDDPLSGTLQFRCRRCSRDTRLTAEKLAPMLDKFAEVGVFDVDISYLPF